MSDRISDSAVGSGSLIIIGEYLAFNWMYLAFLRGFVLWKLHEIKFIRSVVLFYVPEIFC